MSTKTKMKHRRHDTSTLKEKKGDRHEEDDGGGGGRGSGGGGGGGNGGGGDGGDDKAEKEETKDKRKERLEAEIRKSLEKRTDERVNGGDIWERKDGETKGKVWDRDVYESVRGETDMESKGKETDGERNETTDADGSNGGGVVELSKPFHFNDGRRFIFAKENRRKSKSKEDEMNFLYEKQKAFSRIALLSATDSR